MGSYKITHQVTNQFARVFILPAVGQLCGSLTDMHIRNFYIGCRKVNELPRLQSRDAAWGAITAEGIFNTIQVQFNTC